MISRTMGLAAALLLAAAVSAHALDDARQILVAGNAQGEGATQYGGPGMSNVYGTDFPGTGQGKDAAAIRMPAGTLTNLKVNLVTQTTPSSGSLRVRVLQNGMSTNLTCALMATGTCNSATSLAIAANDKIVLKVSNNFANAGTSAWTATLEFD